MWRRSERMRWYRPVGAWLLALALSACVSVPVEVKVNPAFTTDEARLSTIQFHEPERDKVLRAVRDFATARGLQPVKTDARLLGPGWTKEQYQLSYTVRRWFHDQTHAIRLTLLYKEPTATIQLLDTGDTRKELAELELALLDALRQTFGMDNVVKIGG